MELARRVGSRNFDPRTYVLRQLLTFGRTYGSSGTYVCTLRGVPGGSARGPYVTVETRHADGNSVAITFGTSTIANMHDAETHFPKHT
jgi:hypothetical protein